MSFAEPKAAVTNQCSMFAALWVWNSIMSGKVIRLSSVCKVTEHKIYITFTCVSPDRIQCKSSIGDTE